MLDFVERTICECCQGSSFNILYEKAFTDPEISDFLQSYYKGALAKDALQGHLYSINQCKDCGFVFQKYILDPKSMQVFYDEVIDNQESLEKKQKAGFAYFDDLAKSMGFIAGLFPNKKPYEINVLDFGMGWGYWASMARSYGFDVRGAELSKERIAFGKRNGLRIIEDLENSDLRFDFIYTHQVFEHVDTLRDTLGMVISKLKTGGVLRFAVPNGNTTAQDVTQAHWRPSKGPIQPLEHINAFSWKVMVRLLKSFSMEPVGPSDLQGAINKFRAGKHICIIKTPSWFFKKT